MALQPKVAPPAEVYVGAGQFKAQHAHPSWITLISTNLGASPLLFQWAGTRQ